MHENTQEVELCIVYEREDCNSTQMETKQRLADQQWAWNVYGPCQCNTRLHRFWQTQDSTDDGFVLVERVSLEHEDDENDELNEPTLICEDAAAVTSVLHADVWFLTCGSPNALLCSETRLFIKIACLTSKCFALCCSPWSVHVALVQLWQGRVRRPAFTCKCVYMPIS